MSYYPNQQPGYPPPQHPQSGLGYQQPPPPQHSPYPPPQNFGGPTPYQQGGFQQQLPPQNFQPPPGPPPSQRGFHNPPPGPPPGQYPPSQQQGGFAPPTQASPGYDARVQAQGDASADAQALRKAMKRLGTDEKTLINILSKPAPLHMALLRRAFESLFKRDLLKDVTSETSGNFGRTMQALVRGPLAQDVFNVREAVQGMGTKEDLLNDVLLARSNADMHAIINLYRQTYNRSLVTDVSDDLSFKTKDLFAMVTSATRAEEGTPIYPQEIDRDVSDLYSSMRGPGTDQIPICRILSSRSDGQLRAIAQQFEQRYRTTLEEKIKDDFSGHMLDALVLIVRRATDRAMCDAVQLEDAMAGIGTKDILLLNRIVRVHWDRAHMDQVKRAYQFKYKRDLISRVKGETSGDYEKALVACLT